MAKNPDDDAGHSQAHGWCSYPLSFPSEPPDIKNWFSTYEYESPEAPELIGDHGCDRGSETQDPFECRNPEHALLKRDPQDGGVALKNSSRGQTEHEVFVTGDSVPVCRSTVDGGAKRKQSRRHLFVAGFLDEHGEDAPERHVFFGMEGNAVEPTSNCNHISLADTEESHEVEIKHGKPPTNCSNAISLAHAEGNQDHEAKQSKLLANCKSINLAQTEGNQEHQTESSKLPSNCNAISLSHTEENQEHETAHSKMPTNCNAIGLADTEENSRGYEIGCGKPLVLALQSKDPEEKAATDGFVSIKNKKSREECKIGYHHKPPMGRAKPMLQENGSNLEQKVSVQRCSRSPLGDRTNFAEVDQLAAAVPTAEHRGKWKCPRKGKPYAGPPLKQLRLHQWVHRVK